VYTNASFILYRKGAVPGILAQHRVFILDSFLAFTYFCAEKRALREKLLGICRFFI
jgi:hypothetical protein